jgi:endoglucanase
MKISSLLLACTLLLARSVPAVTAVEAYGQLRVEGAHMLDESGRQVQLVGPSLFWSQWAPAYYNPQLVAWVTSDWHATIIRAAMAVEAGGYLTNPTAEKNRVKTVVDAAIAQGIYVLIDWHDHNAEEHGPQAQKFFSEMAREYGDYPNVIYEIFNEPEAISWKTIYDYALPVIDSIRAHDSDNIIVVGTGYWSRDITPPTHNPIPRSNVMYTMHFYAATDKDALRKAAYDVMQLGTPLFVTEWGTSEGDGNGYLDEASTNQWFSLMDALKISWCNWSITTKAETSAALTAGASATGPWSASNLSRSGTLVRAHMRQYAEPQLPSAVVPNAAAGHAQAAPPKARHLMVTQGSVLVGRGGWYGLDGRRAVGPQANVLPGPSPSGAR